MENIIFCGGCGTFISATEISAGKASKINNIYYCQKCSTGTQPAPARPAAGPGSKIIPPRPAAPRPVGPAPAAPARPVAGPAPIKRPAPQPTVAMPVKQPAPGAVPARPAGPVQAQKPLAARPVVPQPPKGAIPRTPAPVSSAHLDETVPINPQPAGRVGPAAKPAPQKIQKTVPPQPPVKTSQTSRLRPVPVRESPEDMNDEGLEEASRRFGKAKSGKGGIKKIYLIAGAAVVVLIVVIAIIVSMSNAAKQKAKEEHEAKLNKYYKEVVETEKDFADNPQKVIDKIKEHRAALKGTDYEKKLDAMEQNAKALVEIIDKIKELEKPVDTLEDVEKRLKDISAARSNPAVSENKTVDGKLKGLLTDFTKQKKKLAEEERKAKEAQEAAEKKAYEDFKAKIDKLREQKDWKTMLRECDILLGRPNGLQYQEEADKIKEEAKAEMEDQQEKAKKRKEWQVLNDDITKWERSGDSKSEIYVDDDKIMLKNTSSSSNRGAVTIISNDNEKEGWKDFTMTLEFKVLGGSLKMFLRGGYQAYNIPGLGTINLFGGIQIPFPRKFKDEWQKYTIELKGKKLTISGTGLAEPKTTDVQEGTGGIGINLEGGDNIIIKELKVKVTE